jgi:hypothetical protein
MRVSKMIFFFLISSDLQTLTADDLIRDQSLAIEPRPDLRRILFTALDERAVEIRGVRANISLGVSEEQ